VQQRVIETATEQMVIADGESIDDGEDDEEEGMMMVKRMMMVTKMRNR
jgi:hypothetical protein